MYVCDGNCHTIVMMLKVNIRTGHNRLSVSGARNQNPKGLESFFFVTIFWLTRDIYLCYSFITKGGLGYETT
jgi:hypothetical protein